LVLKTLPTIVENAPPMINMNEKIAYKVQTNNQDAQMPCTNIKQKKSNRANCSIHEEIIKVKKRTNMRVVIQNRMN
jgi:hypothetical protein